MTMTKSPLPRPWAANMFAVLSDQRFMSANVNTCSSPSGLHQTMARRSGSFSAMSSTMS